MPNKIPIPPGTRFGRLKVVCGIPNRKGRLWSLCICDCGKTAKAINRSLREGLKRSCGCLMREARYKRPIIHGLSKTYFETVRRSMIDRCYNKKNRAYHNYGARGIKVCDRWLESIVNFASDMGPRPDGHTLDRIDVNGNYEPSNCRWATWETQAKNRRPIYRFKHRYEKLLRTLAEMLDVEA